MALVVAACAGCAFLAHRAMSDAQSPAWALFVASIPLTVIVVSLARRAAYGAALGVVAVLGLAAWWMGAAGLERHAADIFFVEHAGMMLALAILFGRTLVRGREPLCTRFARLVHGSLDAEAERYTRRLTITWTVFFATICAASCALYLTHLVEAWSLLANVLTPSLVALLFAVEYAVRRHALPHHEQVGFLAAVHAFRRHMAGTEASR
jgi:uncharacterized membrane protein